jgi:hypothetical protein
MARASASMKIVRISANRLFYRPGSNLIAASRHFLKLEFLRCLQDRNRSPGNQHLTIGTTHKNKTWRRRVHSLVPPHPSRKISGLSDSKSGSNIDEWSVPSLDVKNTGVAAKYDE